MLNFWSLHECSLIYYIYKWINRLNRVYLCDCMHTTQTYNINPHSFSLLMVRRKNLISTHMGKIITNNMLAYILIFIYKIDLNHLPPLAWTFHTHLCLCGQNSWCSFGWKFHLIIMELIAKWCSINVFNKTIWKYCLGPMVIAYKPFHMPRICMLRSFLLFDGT
jgi:hypothetical protein